jgi:LacI family repressor for deo operon, udp, cdd, tsx, nupC, and nupG
MDDPKQFADLTVAKPKMMAKPKMKDIADLAGVSTATVSRALAGSPLVAEETRLSVEEIVRRTGYTVSQAGRGLRLQASRQILVLLPTISNPFFAEIVQGIDEEAQKSGYSILIGSTEGSVERERLLARQLRSGAVDGLVLMTGRLPAILAGLSDATSRIVVVSEQLPEAGFCTIGIDNPAAARVATLHLVELGHRRIAHIAGPPGNVLTGQRLAGYRAALDASGIGFDRALVASGDFTVISGSRAMGRLLALGERPTAVFCGNDDMALGAMSAARQAGLAIPRDLSIVGFDDLDYAAFIDPTLTTIRQPRRRFGQLAAAKVIVPDGSFAAQTLAFELVVRGSTVRYGSG